MKILNRFNSLAVSAVIFLAIPIVSNAQGSPIPVPPTLSSNGIPRAGATITICGSPSIGGPPCTNYATIFKDQAESQQIIQPGTSLITDGLGNCCVVGNGAAIAIYATPGIYTYTISGAGIAAPQGPYPIVAPCFLNNCAGGGGIGVVQTYGTPNDLVTSPSIVNAAVLTAQPFASSCTSTPCVAAGSLNAIGKTFDIEASGSTSFLNTSTQFGLYPALNPASGFTPITTLFAAPSGAGSGGWWIRALCTVTATGTNGGYSCSWLMLFFDSGGVTQFRTGGVNLPSGVNLTLTASPTISIFYTTASTQNIGSMNYAISHQHN